MQKLIFVLLILGGVAYAAQTRIKIGSSSWGYQIEQGPNIRTEFASEDGVASGFYQFRVGNETKKVRELKIKQVHHHYHHFPFLASWSTASTPTHGSLTSPSMWSMWTWTLHHNLHHHHHRHHQIIMEIRKRPQPPQRLPIHQTATIAPQPRPTVQRRATTITAPAATRW